MNIVHCVHILQIKNMKNESKLLIIDGSALIHRAYHALPHFSTAEGIPTNALYGFIKMVLSLVDILKPDYFALCFDTPTPTFRNKLSKDYQATRAPAPDDLKQQFPLVHEFVAAAQLNFFMKDGYEADDVIGTVAHFAQQYLPHTHIYIVTGDRDILQLVDRNTTVVMPKIGVSNMEFVNEETVVKKFGVPPEKIIDYKAFVGDSSDNYPGVKGIGPKKAQELLSHYGSFDYIYNHINELDEKTQRLLTTYKENALLSRTLATIVDDVPISIKKEQLVFKGIKSTPKLIAFLDKYTLRSIKKQLQIKPLADQKVTTVDKKTENQLSFF